MIVRLEDTGRGSLDRQVFRKVVSQLFDFKLLLVERKFAARKSQGEAPCGFRDRISTRRGTNRKPEGRAGSSTAIMRDSMGGR